MIHSISLSSRSLSSEQATPILTLKQRFGMGHPCAYESTWTTGRPGVGVGNQPSAFARNRHTTRLWARQGSGNPLAVDTPPGIDHPDPQPQVSAAIDHTPFMKVRSICFHGSFRKFWSGGSFKAVVTTGPGKKHRCQKSPLPLF